MLGNKDETAGCRLCVAVMADGGSVTLRLRLSNASATVHGKYAVVTGVRFAYGHEQVLAALANNADYAACRRERGERSARAMDLGQAISYRFKRDAKGWRVFVTRETVEVPMVTDRKRGAVGVDLNADHLAACETDACGNYVHAFRVPLVTCGKSRYVAGALIGDAVARVVDYAKRVGKPVVIERLDFREKKAALEGESRKYARMLSSLSYAKKLAWFPVEGPPPRGGDLSGQPGFQFGDRSGEVHGEVRAQRSPGSGPGAGPSFAWLFRAHPAPLGSSRRPCRLPRTREEARVDVLGCGSGTVETGACSEAPAGEVRS